MLRFSTKPILRHPASRYALALLAAAIALYLRAALMPLLGLGNPYHTVWLGVVFCAWFCGVGPSILATLVMVLGVWYWFISPVRSFAFTDPREFFGVAGFLLFAGLIITIGERARRTQAKLNAAHDQMESTVKERTAELASANQKLHELSTNLLHLQDAAGRRLARDLHDSVGQLLAVIGMNLSALDHENLAPEAARLLTDSKNYLNEVIKQVRTISHLLHPPLLDESGLEAALTNYVDGFAQRSKIAMNLQVSPDLPRFAHPLEIAVFRIVQECLTNAHRHAEASTVTVSVRRSNGGVVVEVSDDGKGMRPGQPLGVGLSGMQERVRELHGVFRLDSTPRGTTVTATFPTAELRPIATAATSSSAG